jgi:hypothetical protein
MINETQVIFNVASMPSRADSLHKVILAILPQCDEINVYLNEYNYIPEFLFHPKVNYYRSQDHAGDLGDVGKFFRVSDLNGYVFTIDDDLAYPPTYAEDMVRTIERLNRKALVTCHGRVLHTGRPCTSLYKDYAKAYNCTKYCPDGYVHIPGTGVLAFHTSTFKPKLSIFKATNMADVWIALECQRLKLPIFVPEHKVGYISEYPGSDVYYSIWAFCHHDDSFQTSVINSVKKWRLYK